jgi:hypothetical protein
MGTRFLLTSDSPVPDAIKQIYLAQGRHRHRRDDPGRRPSAPRAAHRRSSTGSSRTNAITSLPRAIANAIGSSACSGTPWLALIREAISMKRSQELSWSQVVMAAERADAAARVDGRGQRRIRA